MEKKLVLKIILFCILLTSCSKRGEKNRDYSNVTFESNYFKVVLDSFILNTKNYSIQEYDDILISLYTENNDTILAFENAPPFELKNFKSVFKYDNFKFYCYVPNSLDKKLNTLIKIESNKPLDKNDIILDTTEIDIIYRTSYIINGNKIKLRKVPLEWSTDSISK